MKDRLIIDIVYYTNTLAGFVFVTSSGELVYALSTIGEKKVNQWFGFQRKIWRF